MKKRYLILFAIVAATLMLLLSGCGAKQDELEGKYIVTFELNGGKMDIGSTEVDSKINYAYEPDSFLMDPSTYGNYKLYRPGYIFTGWYKTEACNETDKWDFKTEKLSVEKMTLYAGWVKEISYTFTVCYFDGTAEQILGNYNVSEGDEFEDYRNFAKKREGFTPNGFFKDAECQTPWNDDDKHPGGEEDTDIKIYVKYIEGEWMIAGNYDVLKSAIGKGNIYLTADIDCEGKPLDFAKNEFKYVFEGNGHKISNFTVEKFDMGAKRSPKSSIFGSLGEGATIKNVSFENVTFNYTGVSMDGIERMVASLANKVTSDKITVENVSVSGKIVTDYDGTFEKLNKMIYEETEKPIDESTFTSNIVIEKQN